MPTFFIEGFARAAWKIKQKRKGQKLELFAKLEQTRQETKQECWNEIKERQKAIEEFKKKIPEKIEYAVKKKLREDILSAILSDDSEKIKFLIKEAKIDPNDMHDYEGLPWRNQTLLSYAIYHHRTEAIKALLEAKADPNPVARTPIPCSTCSSACSAARRSALQSPP